MGMEYLGACTPKAPGGIQSCTPGHWIGASAKWLARGSKTR